MKAVLSTLIGAAIATAATCALAANDMSHDAGMGMGTDMKMMDTNHDGMISKAEFMKYHESMWARMKKDKNGMVDMKDMHGDMMKGDSMMKSDNMTKGDKMMKNDSSMKAERAKDSMGK